MRTVHEISEINKICNPYDLRDAECDLSHLMSLSATNRRGVSYLILPVRTDGGFLFVPGATESGQSTRMCSCIRTLCDGMQPETCEVMLPISGFFPPFPAHLLHCGAKLLLLNIACTITYTIIKRRFVFGQQAAVKLHPINDDQDRNEIFIADRSIARPRCEP